MKLAFWKKSDRMQRIELHPKKGGYSWIFKVVLGLVILGLLINFVLLLLLNDKTAALRKDKELMAESINRTSIVMDKNSGTAYAKNLSVESLINEDTFQNSLPVLTKQATELTKERDALAKTLSSISSLLDEATRKSEAQFANFNSYEQSSKLVYDMIKKSMDVNNVLATFIVNISEALQQNIPDKNEFISEARFYVDPAFLKSLINNVDKEKQHLSELTDEISKKDKAITELKNTIKNTSGSEDEIKRLFNEQRKELERIKSDYEALKSNVPSSDGFDDENDENDEEVQSNTSTPQPLVQNEVRTVFPEYYYKLRGKVVEYNSKWGFVILDFGADTKLNVEIDGVFKEVTVPAPLGQELYISRGDQYIAKAKIVNVYAKYSVANVIFPANGEVAKGDSVFFDNPGQ